MNNSNKRVVLAIDLSPNGKIAFVDYVNDQWKTIENKSKSIEFRENIKCKIDLSGNNSETLDITLAQNPICITNDQSLFNDDAELSFYECDDDTDFLNELIYKINEYSKHIFNSNSDKIVITGKNEAKLKYFYDKLINIGVEINVIPRGCLTTFAGICVSNMLHKLTDKQFVTYSLDVVNETEIEKTPTPVLSNCLVVITFNDNYNMFVVENTEYGLEESHHSITANKNFKLTVCDVVPTEDDDEEENEPVKEIQQCDSSTSQERREAKVRYKYSVTRVLPILGKLPDLTKHLQHTNAKNIINNFQSSFSQNEEAQSSEIHRAQEMENEGESMEIVGEKFENSNEYFQKFLEHAFQLALIFETKKIVICGDQDDDFLRKRCSEMLAICDNEHYEVTLLKDKTILNTIGCLFDFNKYPVLVKY